MLKIIKYTSLFLIVLGFLSCTGESTEAWEINGSSKKKHSSIYGLKGSYHVAQPWEEIEHNMSVAYYPSHINKASSMPVIFFVPGWKSVNHKDYETLLKFMASHGYMVIYAKDDLGDYSAKHLISYYEQMLKNSNISCYIDSSNMGVVGHSSGGGHAFKVLDEFSTKGWGSKSRFLLALDPWFAFDMNKSDMRSLPSNTNVLFVQFGKGGESISSNTDSRIPLSEYSLLSSIDAAQKDYQVFEDANHAYPKGNKNYSEMQGVLKPLDALMKYTFKKKQSQKAHKIALGQGSDNPYNNAKGIQIVREIEAYNFRCDGKDNSTAYKTLIKSDIDYCTMQW